MEQSHGPLFDQFYKDDCALSIIHGGVSLFFNDKSNKVPSIIYQYSTYLMQAAPQA